MIQIRLPECLIEVSLREPRYPATKNHKYLTKCDILCLKKVKSWGKTSKVPRVVFKMSRQNLKKTINFVFKVSDFSRLSQCLGKLRLTSLSDQN